MAPESSAAISVPLRRLAPGSLLWQHFRAPEKADSRSSNHTSTNRRCDFGAPQTPRSRISALAAFPSPRAATQ